MRQLCNFPVPATHLLSIIVKNSEASSSGQGGGSDNLFSLPSAHSEGLENDAKTGWVVGPT